MSATQQQQQQQLQQQLHLLQHLVVNGPLPPPKSFGTFMAEEQQKLVLREADLKRREG
jgi:hypothetical protein